MTALLALVLVAAEPLPLGIALEELSYPAPVKFLELTVEGRPERMATMDVPAVGPEKGVPVVLLHGKNFDSGTWAGTIEALTRAGRRTVVPDQLGFNKSSKPDIAYSFDLLARNTVQLHLLQQPVLLITGEKDRTVVLRKYARPAVADTLGNYPALSRAAAKDIPHCTRVEVPNVGHAPHLEAPEAFQAAVLPFLAR